VSSSLSSPEGSTWFGASVVRAKEGGAQVVFHGTAVQGPTFDTPASQLPFGAFRVFDLEQRGAVTESSDARVGFWFTTDQNRARAAAMDAKEVGHGDSAYVYQVFLRILRPYRVSDVRELDPETVAVLAQSARDHGYDGLVFEQGEGQGIDFLVFDPSQIKSANANCGQFDPHDPDICA